MSKHKQRPARTMDPSAILPLTGLVRARRTLGLATALVALGSQFVPLGDNRVLLAELAARARASRDCGA